MNRQRARELRNFIVDTRDRLGFSDDAVMVEYVTDIPLPYDMTVGDVIDLLNIYLEPIET